ncbi:MAG: TRAP transporter small permease [Desulfatirhabdiaceae bacterium]
MKALKTIDTLLERLYQVSGFLAAGLIFLMLILVLINIFSRLIHAFIPGLTEVAGYCMAGSGALGLAYTFGHDGHIRVKMLLDCVKGTSRFALEIWALAVSAGLVSFVAGYMVKMVYFSWVFKDRSDGSDSMLTWISQTPMTFGFIVFSICLVHALIKNLLMRCLADQPQYD